MALTLNNPQVLICHLHKENRKGFTIQTNGKFKSIMYSEERNLFVDFSDVANLRNKNEIKWKRKKKKKPS